MKEEENKSKAIDMAVSQIEKLFGKGSIMRMGERPIEAIPVVSTGSLSLDIALGVGGLPRGRVIEIFGPEASGKTTLALQAVSETQKLGGTAAFIDAEHALDMAYANKIGVKTDELLISQPDTGEQALEIAEILVRSGGADIVVIDSVAALVPRAEIEGDMGDAHMGLQARLMSQALRKLTAITSKSMTTVIFINQIRQKIGIMFGNPETTTGGNALKFYSSMRLDIRRISSIKDGQDIIGSRTRVKVVKNKLAPPFKEVEFDIIFGEGISKEGDILDLAVDAGIIEKAGTWFSYGDIRIGQGRENAKDYLRKNESVKEDIREKILTQYGLKKGES
ncbi:MAG TPA: recombinase RecA [Syntrophorhabdaceae bacterium]|nr:recombinase RecA [Syntrophorhabdaceae bacterium]MDI9561039.1 recombinase RecA [Pseudomonadota bacterium]OQC50380.1 MAG: recombinase A [Deltaproteobacteria bacterium ADurb.Bin026]MBP8698887.1 recombinase RecA [Syntrophorhabdaceae bacterium]MBV6506413.1 Protein RecA [Syntrophorhabdaceae bacterium]